MLTLSSGIMKTLQRLVSVAMRPTIGSARHRAPAWGNCARARGAITPAAALARAWLLAARVAQRRAAPRLRASPSILQRSWCGGQSAKRAVVFIDGLAGTSGLHVRERLEGHPEIQLLSLDPVYRKDKAARRDALLSADAAVLCLPDDAARDAVALLDGANTVVVDTSTAHRVSEGWAYGFPEMAPGQAASIASSKRIANPGCFATGFVGLVRPLVDADLLPPSTPTVVHAVSGYSGGGQGLIDVFEGQSNKPWAAFGFALSHKHLPEMALRTGLAKEPLFCPAVGDFKQGMLVSVPLRLSQLAPGTTGSAVQEALAKHYEGQRFVSVAPLNSSEALECGAFLRPDTLNNTNHLELFVFANEAKGTLWLLARLDNLGKGASGACVQNINLALGFDEALGLEAAP
mmetsp:Transcript_44866/g.124761  ORF Transcript_44866/g.124761 Transcript_44866/m.124761 type:complete len:404 (-) Transcript_44866:374-1585(-)